MAGKTMTDARVTYRPASGETAWWAAVDDGALAALSPTLTAATAARVWRGLGGGGIGAVIEALTGAFGTSLSAIPPFALAIVEPGGVRVAVRGDLEIVIEGTAPEAVSGVGVATWTERFIAGATTATVLPAAGSTVPTPEVPVVSGVVRADLVRIDLTASDPSPQDGAAPAGAAVPADAAEMADAEEPSAAVEPAASAISSESTAVAAAAAAVPPAASVIDAVPGLSARDATRTEALDTATDAVDEAGRVAAAAEGSADTLIPEATATESVPAPVDEYDLLWGETVARPVSAAAASAVAAADDADDADDAVDADDEADAVPPSDADTPTAPASSDELGDHDGATIAVAELRAMRAERPPFESTDSVPARRPAQGRIRLSTGRVVELERPVIIGRRPKSTRTSGAELPTLVAVDSPEQDISRSHVEIRAEGEHVLVTDLATTNGTVLLRGGSEPVRLHPNEPTMVVTGDVLDLGDDVTVIFEDLP